MTTTRRFEVLGSVALMVACSSPGSGPPATAPARPPNVVVILADDLGYGDVCAYGCRTGRTPHLDALAAGGVRFTDGYVSAPLCSPTRAGLLTGRYQQRFGHEYGAGSMQRSDEQGLGTPTSEIMLPELLRRAGYATGMVGKWHLGSQPRFQPQERGFDEFFGFLHGGNLYMDPAHQPAVVTVAAPTLAGGRPPHEYNHRPPINPIQRGTDAVEEPDYLTDAFTREAVDFIERHAKDPFFLYVAYNAPHTPLQVTRKYYDRFADVESEPHRVFAAMVSAIDDGVGAISTKLRETGLQDRTLVVFLSDNGCATYVGACHNDPLTGGKLTHFEGGVRVPFLASWPGRVAAGRVESMPVSSLDILPTAIGLAGVEKPPGLALDGIDLGPLLTDRQTLRERSLFWRNADNFAIRNGPWKLVSVNDERLYLFDLSRSAAEGEDLADQEPATVQRLLDEYRGWEEQMREPLWSPVNRAPLSVELPWLKGEQTIEVTI